MGVFLARNKIFIYCIKKKYSRYKLLEREEKKKQKENKEI